MVRLPVPRCALVLPIVFASALAQEVPQSDSIALAVNDYLQAHSADLLVI